jgi:heat shock protein HtpX
MAGIDFDARIRRNRTRMLVLTLLAAVNLWLLAIVLVAAVYVLGTLRSGNLPSPILIPVLGILGGTIAAPIWLRQRLRAAASTTLKAVGAHPPAVDDGNRLSNLAQEIAVARGLPPLQVALIDDPAPNAITVGRDPRNSTVAVTTGLVQLLTRDELGAVVAVEVCSIALHDVAVGTVAVACLGVTGSISDTQGVNRDGSRDWLGWIVCAPARFFSSKLKLVTMHDRETSADILACDTTRNPMALLTAMRKIGAHQGDVARWSPATADLWFVSPDGGAAGHTSLDQRVAAIEGSFGVSAPPPGA